MREIEEKLFSDKELMEIRSKFHYVNTDIDGSYRLFFDNAGGSLRLIAAENRFNEIDKIPDCSEHSNKTAHFLDEIVQAGRKDLMDVIFNAKRGVLYPGYSASQIMMEICRVFAENAKGTNVVTTALEHPSSFDGIKIYAEIYNREFRVAPVNKQSGGVDAQSVIDLIDENTAILSCMYASNISGYIYDIEKIFKEARKKNPHIFIICDAVQHAPHAALDPEKFEIDAMNFAPYKFFGVRGFSVAYLSNRVAPLMHHKLIAKPSNDWDIGSPAPAHYAAVSEIVNYVISLGEKDESLRKNRRKCFELGMKRIAEHERALLDLTLNGTNTYAGFRNMNGIKVKMDGASLQQRDFIIGIEFDNVNCLRAVQEYEKRGIITFERTADSIYSKRMVEAFDSKGVVRISPLHINTVEEIERLLKATEEIASL